MSDCNWHEEDEDSGLWVSDCGNDFMLMEGTPSENQMIFCCRCGNPLVEHKYVRENDDE